MTGYVIRTVDSRSEGGGAVQILIDHGRITISDGDLTDDTSNSLCLDVENAGKLGKVLVALAAALETEPIRAGDGNHSVTERSYDERALLRESQCVACGNTFTYAPVGRPPLTCSPECRRERARLPPPGRRTHSPPLAVEPGIPYRIRPRISVPGALGP
jgi:hypothetical protein